MPHTAVLPLNYIYLYRKLVGFIYIYSHRIFNAHLLIFFFHNIIDNLFKTKFSNYNKSITNTLFLSKQNVLFIKRETIKHGII